MKRNKLSIDLVFSDVLNKRVAHIFEVVNDNIENVYLLSKPNNKNAVFNHIQQIVKNDNNSIITFSTNDFPTYLLSKETKWSSKENLSIKLLELENNPRKEIYQTRIGKLVKNYEEEQKKTRRLEASSNTPDKNTLVVYTDASVRLSDDKETPASGYGVIIRAPGSDNIMYKIKAKFKESIPSAEAEAQAVRRSLRFIKNQIEKGSLPDTLKIEIRSDNLGNVEMINNHIEDFYDIERTGTLKDISDYIKNNFKENQVAVKWVKGHHIDPYNIMVDQLAKESVLEKNSRLVVAFRDKEIIENLRKNKHTRKKKI